MLRQALDAAKGATAEAASSAAASSMPLVENESVSLAQDSSRTSTSRGDYGSTSIATKTLEEESAEYGGDLDSLQSGGTQSQAEATRIQIMGQTVWRRIKDGVVLVLNVDNLWDDGIGVGEALTRRDHLRVLFWFFLLAMAYAGERSTFYLIVDRAGPFRLFSAEMITASHALLLGLSMVVSAASRRDFHLAKLGIPLVDVALMALLDSAALILALIAGYHVPPTLTVILVQFTLPMTIFFTQIVHPDGRIRLVLCPVESENEENEAIDEDADAVLMETDPFIGRPLPGWGGLSREHLWGSSITCLAVFFGLCPAFIAFIHPEVFAYADVLPLRTAYNSILFALASIPAAASQLYKEHVFLRHKQPVDASYLNALLSVLQFTFIMIVSPLVYTLQGLAAPGNWARLYPSTEFSDNFFDGLKCFLGQLDDMQARRGYAEPAECRHSFVIVFFHVLSIIVVGVAVDKIVHAGATKVMYRGISAGIIVAVISMYIYDLYDPDFNYHLDGLHFVCTTLIIIGSEVYHRVSIKDSAFETVYPEIDALYDDD